MRWGSRHGRRSARSIRRTTTRLYSLANDIFYDYPSAQPWRLPFDFILSLTGGSSDESLPSSFKLTYVRVIREYLKRDDQILVFRLQNEESPNCMTKTVKDEDRPLASSNGNDISMVDADVYMEDVVAREDAEGAVEEQPGSKVIVIHPGSQNLRIGLASDALPKTVPMAIARKSTTNECDGEPKPKRLKGENGARLDSEEMFGKEVR